MKKNVLIAVAVIAVVGIGVAVWFFAFGSSDTKTATASLKAELLQQSASQASPFTFTDTQAQCVASAVAKGVGPSKLRQYGLLDANNHTTTKTLKDVTLSVPDATTVVNAIINCQGEATFTKVFADKVNATITGEGAQTQRDCLQNKLTVAVLKPVMISSLSGDQAPATKLNDDLLACIPSSR